MELIIDNREKDLIKLIDELNEKSKTPITIKIEQLCLGDIIFRNKHGQEIIIIERKSINDLASSIKDGRYNEQSLRLTNISLHNHNIIYLIEGKIEELKSRFNKSITKETIYSTLCSLLYFKGFSVIRSFNINETAIMILQFFNKIQKEKKREMYYKPEKVFDTEIRNKNIIGKNEIILDKIENIEKISEETNNKIKQTQMELEYVSVIKKVKKDNITPENIGAIILCQIPGISSTTSMAIMNKFGSLYNLLCKLKEDSNCLNGITYITNSGQKRRISNKCINSVKTFLLYQKQNNIIIN